MKIVTFSFDDCEIYDRRLAEMMRYFGMKATFFLISGQLGMKVPFHRYGVDTVVERISASEIPETYRGMEVASHTQYHRLPPTENALIQEINESVSLLSRACGYAVCGMAYPGGHCTQAQINVLRNTQLKYARAAAPSYDFAPPQDWFRWQPTCHYADEKLPALLERFAASDGDLLLHIYGHSYELTQPDPQKSWIGFERLLRQLAALPDIRYCTNIEAVRLLKAS